MAGMAWPNPLSWWLLATLLPAWAQFVQGRMLLDSGTATPCQTAYEGTLPVFSSFDNISATSASGQHPSQGSCTAWNLTIKEHCRNMNSMLLVELWMTENGRPFNRSRAIDGVYLLANAGPPPLMFIHGNGSLEVTGYNPYVDSTQPPDLSNQFYDLTAIFDSLPYQRLLVPAGKLNVDQLTLSLITSLAMPSWQGYSLRASCMLASQLPCPRTGPDMDPQGCSGQGSCRVALSQTTSSGPVCSCKQGYADPACGTHVINLTGTALKSTTIKNLNIPGRTWAYFALTGQPNAETRMLVELLKPPLTAGMWAPSLVVVTKGVPGVSDIWPSTSPQATCSCTNCTCRMPDEAQDILYATRVQQAANRDPVTWYIGVFNNLPFGQPVNNLLALQLRSRWTSGPRAAPPLCPADCAGQGQCTAVQGPPLQDPNTPAPYSCNCQSGFGGSYCQGPSQVVQLAGSGFDSGRVTLLPGAWQFYTLSPPPTSGQVVLSWAPEIQQGISTLFLMFSATYGAGNIANQYQYPVLSFLWNTTMSFPMPMPTAGMTGWRMSVLNSDASMLLNSSFRLFIGEPPPSSSFKFTSLLQMALIGSVSALAFMFLFFLIARVVLMRRHAARAAAREAAADLEMQQRLGYLAAGGPGVPAQLVQTFPCFAYNAASFAAMLAKGKLLEAQEVGADGRYAAYGAHRSPGIPPGQQSGMLVVQTSLDAGVPVADGIGDKQSTVCSICIADFEDGELCRHLPCQHTFHAACIDAWMTQHTTCPNCRWHLVPIVYVPPAAVDAGGQPRRQPTQDRAPPILDSSTSASAHPTPPASADHRSGTLAADEGSSSPAAGSACSSGSPSQHSPSLRRGRRGRLHASQEHTTSAAGPQPSSASQAPVIVIATAPDS